MITSPAFWVPDRFVPSAWLEHAPFAFWVIEAHRPGVLVELGTHNGFSYLAFCQAVDRLGVGTRCYAVDHWKGDDHAGFYGEEVYDTLRAYHDPKYLAFSELLRMSFDDAARHFDDGTVDLLHIDGAHHIEDVTADFNTWLPKMSDRGVILFHDINVHRDDFGVYALWDRLIEQYPYFSFDHGHGLGVLGVGEKASETLGPLFELQQTARGNEIRHMFARLGAAVADRSELARLANAEQAAQETAARLANAEQEAHTGERNLRHAEEQLERTASELADLAQRYSDTDRRAIQLEEALQSARMELAWAHGEIEGLRTSTSWKATAPLRLASRTAKWVARQGRRGLKVLWWTVTLQLPRRVRRYRAYTSATPLRAPATVESEVARFNAPGVQFEELDTSPFARDPLAKVIAFYLPQFHTFPENDEWWGKGFTEWRNVTRGLPRFGGHHQPRLPRDLGFYDLADPTVMPRQIALAKGAGIHAFCFYYYRFSDGRLLDRPVEQFLADPSLTMPFCLMWANENWTRTWDGLDSEILRGHDYTASMERDLLEDMIRHFADPRYLRVDGRPLFLIYRPALVPEPRATFERWRSAIETATGERVLLLMAQSFEDWDPRPYGLDGAVEFPPHKLAIDLPERAGEVEPFSPDFAGSVRNYDDLIAEAARVAVPDFPLIRTVVPSWDNEARRPGRGLTFAGSSPASYQHWLSSSIGWARKHPLETEPLVFVNAWNEWAEGAYLEPDVYFGAAYLNATRRAVVSLPQSGEHRRIVLVGHDAARHGAQQLLLALGRTFSRQFGFEVEFLLLAGGDLLSSYQEVGEVHVFEASDPKTDDLIVSLLNRGFDQAIANTTVSGPMVARLDGTGFRVVSLIHEMGAFIADRGWTDAARAVASSAARIVFPAEFVRERFSTIAPVSIDRSVIAHQGLYRDSMVQGNRESQRISVRTELGITSASHIVLGVGFADLRKGVDLFVQTAVIASRIAPNLHFVWVGGGDRHVRHWLIDAAPTGAHSNVTIIEHTENIDRYYSAADVLFVSSREDAFPSTVMEAMSVGLPVVGFAGCTGTESLIERAGRVVDAFDLEAVVAGISALIQGETPERVEARRQIIADEFRFDDYAFRLEKELEPDTASVTVIVPTFNYAALLGQRMAGIFSQTHPVFEVIVLDDASIDNTVDTLAEIGRDSRRDFRVVQRETNSGSVWRQWLDGVRMARSEYVWIAEADDDAEPGLLKALIAPFVGADTAPAFAFCDSAQIDGEGRRLGDSYRPYLDEHAGDRFHTDFRMKGSDFLRRHMTVRNLILNASSVLFRRDLLLQVLEEHMDDLVQLRFAGDWIVYSRLCELGDVAFISNPLNIHRRHAGLTLGSNPSDHIAEIELVHGMLTRRLDLPARVQAEQKEYREELLKTLGSGG